MTEHLPECFASLCECDDTHFKSIDCDFSCICPSLRACEQRVEAEWLDRYNYDPDLVWEDALDVARQAVKEICQQNPLIWPTDEEAMQALDAAIDVLKEGGTKEYKVRSTWSAALDAARKAVAGVGVRKDTSHDMRVQALAAIDALREEKP